MFLPRLLSTLVLLVIFLCAFLLENNFGLLVFLLFGAVLIYATISEYTKMVQNIGLSTYNPLTGIVGVLFFIFITLTYKEGTFYTRPVLGYTIVTVLVIVSWLSFMFFPRNKEHFYKIVNSLSAIVLLGMPLSFLGMIYMSGYGTTYRGMKLALFLIIVTKSGDIGAYAFGTLFSKRPGGNHKIVPGLSPKKSWEGTISGVIVSIAIAFLFYWLLSLGNVFGLHEVLFLGALLFVGGFFGDLSESALKRVVKVKDSGSVIPGIGGTIDLVDSLLINAPIFYIFMKIFGIGG